MNGPASTREVPAPPRGVALALLVLVGLPWVLLLLALPGAAAPIWFFSALVLWVRALVRVTRGGGRARDVGRWWLSTLAAPAIALVLLIDALSRRGHAPAPEPTATEAPAMTDPVLIRLDEAERQVRSLERELRELRALVGVRTRPEPAAPAAPAAARTTRPAPAPAPAARPAAPPPSRAPAAA
ncbi:MAG TPA: hypothetical protein VK874_02290, partial [Gaiellaceae bacterium]|nr:hypothetical protein [Gaiellaceae bacterium]